MIFIIPRLFITINNGDNIIVKCDTDLVKVNRSRIDEFVYVEGAPYHTSQRALLPAFFFYDRAIKSLKTYANSIVDSIGFDGPLLTGVYESLNRLYNSFYTEVFTDTPDGGLSDGLSKAYLLMSRGININSNHASFLAERYQSLTQQQKDSYYGKKLKEYATLCVGQPFPEFNLPQPNGKLLALKEVTAKNKVTIVEFWSSQSIDRKKFQNELLQLYKRYHDKGLDIIGFSSDVYEEDWKEVLQNEQLPWFNVSDLKGKRGMVNTVYHEYGDESSPIRNTTNVLIDSKGKIVAWDVYGAELQWYLWKLLEEKRP